MIFLLMTSFSLNLLQSFLRGGHIQYILAIACLIITFIILSDSRRVRAVTCCVAIALFGVIAGISLYLNSVYMGDLALYRCAAIDAIILIIGSIICLITDKSTKTAPAASDNSAQEI